MGQEVLERKLPSGLSVILLRKPGFSQKFGAFATHYGGMDSAFTVPGHFEPMQVPDGIAHFLEHKLFEKPSGVDVSQLYSQMGMTSNAYTGSYYTVYYFATVERFSEGLDLLLDYVQDPYFTDESVAKEQGIIGQEIQAGLDSPSHMVYYNFMESMFHHHPLKNRTIGSAESIGRITKQLLYSCHDTFYHPSNMAVVVAGDLCFADCLSRVEEDMAGRNYAMRDSIERIVPEEPDSVVRSEIMLEMKVSRPRVMMGFKGAVAEEGEPGREHHKRLLAADLALAAVLGKVTPLYWQLYENATITEGFRFGYSDCRGAGYIWISGESENAIGFVDQLTQALLVARQDGIDGELFEAVRRREIGSFLSTLEEPEQLVGTYITHRFSGLEFMDTMELLEEVTLADGQDFLKRLIRDSNRVVSVVEPLKRVHMSAANHAGS
jgi:predicted Zn-dependent peptidase